MRLGIDIDDVLFPWSKYAHEACEAAGITNGKSITRWEAWLDYGCTKDEFWDVVLRECRRGMLLGRPYPGIVDLLGKIREAGHTVHLVTARGFEGDMAYLVRKDTAYWLRDREVPHDSLTFAKDKTLVKVDAFLDDSIPNVRALLEAGIPAYLRDQPHNRESAEGLARVADLAEFADALNLLHLHTSPSV